MGSHQAPFVHGRWRDLAALEKPVAGLCLSRTPSSASGAVGRSDHVVASDVKDRLGLSAVLVRPDGVVAWAAEAGPETQEAAQAGARWFGEPEEVRECRSGRTRASSISSRKTSTSR
jgi:hypothetical protein